MSQMTSVYDPLDVKLTVIQEFLSLARVLLPSCVDMERRFYSFNHRPIEQSGLITGFLFYWMLTALMCVCAWLVIMLFKREVV